MTFIGPDSDMPLRRAPVAVIDWETTWDSFRQQYPVSVAVVHCELGIKGTEVPVFQSLINPEVRISKEATDIHGIDNDAIRDAPLCADILPQILEFVDGRALASYNLPFDWQILHDECENAGLEAPPFGCLDPLVWAKVADKYKRGKKLHEVAGRRGIRFDAHQAVADAMATAKIMPLLLGDLKRMSGFSPGALDTIKGIWGYTVSEALAWEKWYEDYCVRKDKPKPELKWRSLMRPQML